ncbi:hypothetical protein HHL23_03145 [Chryseobacterium sp. RP-3-3]|uniref:Uncharacterized protein n=1 Tax=Chryseobacterium antibioticum TaxID=2728847 RepID=A0A7Y0AK30_9FLAO|nr:hypothetical protein [Chryseobacterium antibioticum]NML68793.1 hypothetical protein [Chryseobacterium antibioticum]
MKDNKNDSEENKNHKPTQQPRRNLFQGRVEGEKGNAKFPDWDILPPNRIINPRIKNQ